MVTRIPPNFTDIQTARSMSRGVVNVIGVVIDSLPPARSQGTSWISTFTLKASDFGDEYLTGLKIRYFHDVDRYLPSPKVGDVVLLRHINLDLYNGKTIGLSRSSRVTPWVVFEARPTQRSTLSTVLCPGERPPSAAETKYAGYLVGLYRGDGSRPSIAPASPAINVERSVSMPSSIQPTTRKADKFRLVKDAEYGSFSDIVGQVVKTFSEYEKLLLYVTDYTQNKNLFDYSFDNDGRDGDEFDYSSRSKRKWPGPYGRMTIQVTLWEPHSNFARDNIKEDDFVLLRNVHIKPGRSSGVMEGALHTDRQFHAKVGVSLLDVNEGDERLKGLVRRKLEYWRKLKGRLAIEDGKRQLSDGEGSGKKTKKNKRQRKNKPQRVNNQAEATTTSVRPKRDELNPHVRSNYLATPTRTVEQILQNESHWNVGPGGIQYRMPFQNLKYRASVRVVDFFPPNLEDFAVPYNPEYAMLRDTVDGSDLSDSDEEPIIGQQIWEWRFCLLVEDGGPGIHHPPGQRRQRLKLFVTGPDAVFLLSIDPVNLRKNPDVLASLREKLFILWGDLEERKNSNSEMFNPNDTAAINAKPFTCCIKEYGVRVAFDCADENDENDDADENDENHQETSNSFCWERRFRMFDTRVM
ncbi:telomere-binding alpha subunit central domain containing protein [Coccidioides immitis RMSCC 3703]|uniref:Protection of telomeres protein 1 n=1 Tax=Coccidioides immitis RMSCC 3703 TaxID=454286 RepID=A0A0J8QXF3_COCIT|nr:telomere-binding alpha subunit central domain containing protein [Coccidioides immitis RMSCC 3703]